MKAVLTGSNAETPQSEASSDVMSDTSAAAADSVVVATPVASYAGVGVAVGAIAVIALVAALYLARAFFVPLLIGILASYALHPVVDWLKTWHVPRAAGSKFKEIYFGFGYG